MRLRRRLAFGVAASLALAASNASAASQEIPRTPPRAEQAPVDDVVAARNTRSGRDIYASFREGLADPTCPSGGNARWKQHFANAPRRMASANDDVLPLFGYVVDAVREADLPTEYALIPFVESGYKAGARSPSGPAGLWQFIQSTARNHDIAMRAGYDGRLSPVDATRAAVRYLKTLHGMFAGDWRLAVMAYNAGEYRVLGSLRRAGQNARNAKPETLPGLSPITHAYVQKLRALSCLLEQADDREEWLHSLDRPVAHLDAQVLPAGVKSLDAFAQMRGLDAAQLRRFNPAFEGGRVMARKDGPLRVLAPVPMDDGVRVALDAPAKATAPATPAPIVGEVSAPAASQQRSHTVARGESLWTIAHRYGLETRELIARNKLDKGAKIRPGMVLRIDAENAPATAAAGP